MEQYLPIIDSEMGDSEGMQCTQETQENDGC